MSKNKWMKILLAAFLLVCFAWGRILLAADVKEVIAERAIHIDIPVKLEKANVVFNMDHLAFAGDMPVGIKYMHLLANRFKETEYKRPDHRYFSRRRGLHDAE